MTKKPRPASNTYARYRLSHKQLEHLVEFLRRDNHRVDTIRLGETTYRLTKLQDGSTNIEISERQDP